VNPVPMVSNPLPPGEVLPPMRPSLSPPSPTTAPPAGCGGGAFVPGRENPTAAPARKPLTSEPKEKRPHRAGGRFEMINTFVDNTMRRLSHRASLAWVILWRDTKPNGLAQTGVAYLARRMGCSHATAKRALSELRKQELIEIAERGRKGGETNSYRITEAASRRDGGLGCTPDP
jgi:hypothetical protein